MTFSSSSIAHLFETLRDAIIGLKDGTVLFMNPRALKLFGQQTGESASSFLPADMFDFSGENFILSHEINGKSYSVCAAQSDGLWLLSFSEAYVSAAAASSNLAAHISSQMSGPISSMRSAANRLMELGEKKSIEMSPYINILNRGIYQIQRLSRNLALLENISSGSLYLDLKTEDLVEVAGDITDSVNHFFPGAVRLDTDLGGKNELWAEIDKDKFSTMLLNLLANSLQHRGENGQISISLKQMQRHPVITVSDNCGGMSSLAISHAFLKYTNPVNLTDMADGAGFGLAVARGIAEAHGGGMAIFSNTGKGTVVRVKLPVPSEDVVHSESAFATLDGMDLILTELSSVLSHEFYNHVYIP